MPLPIGTELESKYLVEEILGQGGMGVVYRVHDRSLGLSRALKVPTSRNWKKYQVREALLQGSLHHPNIVQVLASVSTPDGDGLLMELVVGPTLDKLVRDRKGLPDEQARPLFFQILDAVEFAHQQPLIHRDLKPENVLLRPVSEAPGFQVKITDFGLARTLDGSAHTGALGTQGYAAPEQLDGGILDARADIYSLGGILYFLYTAHDPMLAGFGAQLPLQQALPPEVYAVVERCLQRDPQLRPGSCAQLRSLLQSSRRGLSISAMGLTLAPPTPGPSSHSGPVVSSHDEQQLRLAHRIARLAFSEVWTATTDAGPRCALRLYDESDDPVAEELARCTSADAERIRSLRLLPPHLQDGFSLDSSGVRRAAVVIDAPRGQSLEAALRPEVVQSLSDQPPTPGGIPPRAALELIRSLAMPLRRAHEAGIFHLDIRPATVYLTEVGPIFLEMSPSGEGCSGPARAHPRVRRGPATPGVRPPEIVLSQPKIDRAAVDSFQLGLLLYQLLVGLPLHSPKEEELLRSNDHEEWTRAIALRMQDFSRAQPAQREVIQLLQLLLSWEPSARPGARDVVKTCERLLSRPDTQRQPSYEVWFEQLNLPDPGPPAGRSLLLQPWERRTPRPPTPSPSPSPTPPVKVEEAAPSSPAPAAPVARTPEPRPETGRKAGRSLWLPALAVGGGLVFLLVMAAFLGAGWMAARQASQPPPAALPATTAQVAPSGGSADLSAPPTSSPEPAGTVAPTSETVQAPPQAADPPIADPPIADPAVVTPPEVRPTRSLSWAARPASFQSCTLGGKAFDRRVTVATGSQLLKCFDSDLEQSFTQNLSIGARSSAIRCAGIAKISCTVE